MEKIEVAFDSPLEIPDLTVIPVVQVSSNYWSRNGNISFFGAKDPIAVVLIFKNEKKVFMVSGEEISIDQFSLETGLII